MDYKINSILKARESDLPYIIPSKACKILYALHYANYRFNSFFTIILILSVQQHPHFPGDATEACSLTYVPRVTKLLSDREPRVLTLKPILFTHYYTTYYHSIDERALGSRISFIPWANHLTLPSSVSSVNKSNDSCPTFLTASE